MAKEFGWRGNLLLALGSTILSLALVIGVGEFAVRYHERHRDTVPGTMPFLYYRHSRLGSALVRDTNYFGWVRVNRQGFRGPEVVEDHPKGMLRIMAVGGSTTFDVSVGGQGRSWPERLAVWLSQADPVRRIEVINAGVPGYRVFDNLIRLQSELYRYKPDLVILYEGHNDLFAAFRWAGHGLAQSNDRPGEIAYVTPWRHWFESNSLLYNKLLRRWQAINFQRAGARARQAAADRQVENAVRSGVGQFRHDLSGFLALARNLGVRVALLENLNVSGPGARQPANPAAREVWERAIPYAPPETVLEAYERYNQVIKEVAADFSITWISTRDFGLVGAEWYSEGDVMHFNERGADRMAQQMARSLIAAGLFRDPALSSSGC